MKTRSNILYHLSLFSLSIFLSLSIFSQKVLAAVQKPQVMPTEGQEAIGTVVKTPGLDRFDTAAGGIGIMLFVSTLIQVATIVAGIWVLFNLIFAGYTYLTSSGDSSAHGKVRDSISMSIIGLIIIVIAYSVIGIIGLLFFGDAGFIINPQVTGPLS